MPPPPSPEAALQEIPLFAGLDKKSIRRLSRLIRVHHTPKGSLIFKKRAAGEHLFIVRAGRIKIFAEMEISGRTKSFAHLQPGDFFGEMSLLDQKGRSLSAQAMTDAELLTLSRKEFQNLLAREKTFNYKIMKALVARLRHANEEIESLVFHSAHSRICRKILETHYRQEKSGGNGHGISITHKELGELAGIRRELATKILSTLRHLKLIAYDEGGRIQVLSASKLREIARF
jgi:CRP/FNR family transcriptional regulator